MLSLLGKSLKSNVFKIMENQSSADNIDLIKEQNLSQSIDNVGHNDSLFFDMPNLKECGYPPLRVENCALTSY